ncbi:MFS transporter [Elstera litoralis]|uniref:MFS transporter n=1 Tax=Elstera litoralis TaxID=552518 RepID=UPI000698722A|nr:MFS transporter [Elstera litoralis]
MRAQPQWLLILAFVVLYKLGDAVAGVMTNPFYLALGFSKSDIAAVGKVWSLVATLIGVFIGGWLVGQAGQLRALMICGILQALSNLVFIWQAQVGVDLAALSVTVFVENATGGMGTAAFVAYISGLSQRQYSATHYALLSAFAATARTFLASGGGWLSEQMNWEWFFGVTALTAIPGLILLLILMRQARSVESA